MNSGCVFKVVIFSHTICFPENLRRGHLGKLHRAFVHSRPQRADEEQHISCHNQSKSNSYQLNVPSKDIYRWVKEIKAERPERKEMDVFYSIVCAPCPDQGLLLPVPCYADHPPPRAGPSATASCGPSANPDQLFFFFFLTVEPVKPSPWLGP